MGGTQTRHDHAALVVAEAERTRVLVAEPVLAGERSQLKWCSRTTDALDGGGKEAASCDLGFTVTNLVGECCHSLSGDNWWAAERMLSS